MTKVFENNVFLDPLTGLPNFFKLIESDVDSVFCNKGTIVIFDIVNFININRDFGRDVGDVYLKKLAASICSVAIKYDNVFVFRTDGDEFTVILNNMLYSQAESLANLIKSDFNKAMMDSGLPNVDIRCLMVSYDNKITSISEFYQILFEQSLKKSNNNGEDRWAEHIIESFTRRIKETLSFFNDAYNLAITDDVSGLFNHRAAKLYLSRLIEDNRESENEFSVLFIDGDNLKRYNKIGYDSGNEMIKKLSLTISNSIGKDDKVFRWLSGDEFLVVLEGADCNRALSIGEQIRSRVEEDTKTWVYPVTVSIGVSSYPVDGKSIKEIIDKAEKANFFAKCSGKNRVARWEKYLDNV